MVRSRSKGLGVRVKRYVNNEHARVFVVLTMEAAIESALHFTRLLCCQCSMNESESGHRVVESSAVLIVLMAMGTCRSVV